MADYAMWMSKTFKLPIVLIPHQIYPIVINLLKNMNRVVAMTDMLLVK